MSYEYRLSRRAERYFARQPKEQQRRIDRALQAVCEQPYVATIALAGRRDGLRRLRIGGLRALLYVRDQIEVVEVTEIGPRGDIYRD